MTKKSRGFGFVVFDNEQVVDNMLADGNMIDMMGTQVSFFKWFPVILDERKHSFPNSSWKLCGISTLKLSNGGILEFLK